MVIEKVNPIGLDNVVADLQQSIASISWGGLLKIYPRCYNAERDKVKTIEHYYANGDYDNLVFAEGNKCFFVQQGAITDKNQFQLTTSLDVYFTLNLKEIKPDIAHRADMEAQSDVLDRILRNVSGVRIDRLITGISSVYDGLKHKANDDVQPYHVFKVRLEVDFTHNQVCCNC